jgi:hypothetical protein
MALVRAEVARPYWDWEGRKYIELKFEDGRVVRAKVPFRYGRVMCRVDGLVPIQELELGASVQVLLEKKIWNGVTHWVILSISFLEP